MPENIDFAVEQNALRENGILGRAGPYGNILFAFTYERLPPEAKQVLKLIANGGPFLFPEHDGNLYGNRSRDLPGTNNYREFTVPTPNVQHRGKRRLVIHDRGIVFFTACHYDRVPGAPGTSGHAEKVAAIDERWRNGFYIVTGLPPDLQGKIRVAIKKIHNSRLPVLVSGA